MSVVQNLCCTSRVYRCSKLVLKLSLVTHSILILTFLYGHVLCYGGGFKYVVHSTGACTITCNSPASSNILINIFAPKGLTHGYCSPQWVYIGNPFLKKSYPVKFSNLGLEVTQNVQGINIFAPNMPFGQKSPLNMQNMK